MVRVGYCVTASLSRELQGGFDIENILQRISYRRKAAVFIASRFIILPFLG